MPVQKSKSESVSAFAAKIAGQKKNWDQTRKAENAGGFASDQEIYDAFDLQEDQDSVTVTSRCVGLSVGVSKGGKGDPYVSFQLIVYEGDNAGLQFSKYIGIANSKGGKKTAANRLGEVVGDLKVLGYDLSDIDFDDLESVLTNDVIPDIKKSKPGVKTRIKRSITDQGGDFLNIDFRNKATLEEPEGNDQEPPPQTSASGNGKKPPTTTSPSDDDLDDEPEPTDEGEEEIVEPEKGDAVLWKAPRKRSASQFVVETVNKTDETVTLKASDGTKHKGIAWAELTFVNPPGE